MGSPFPGMDPYLEDPRLWPDMHQRLITYSADVLQTVIRPRYHARIGERLLVTQPPRAIYADVALIERKRTLREPAAALAAGTDAPVVIDLPPEEVREPFIEIIDLASGGQVVTVIEVLSPANKAPGDDHALYRRKQQDVLSSRANLVEIDLLRRGLPTVFVPSTALDQIGPWHYLVAVSRADRRDQAAVYPCSLRNRLPRIGVPLADPDPDAMLDLQAVFERSYDNGAYADLLDYTLEPRIALDPDDATWVDGLLREKGLR
ncbi:MAG TPA: DUF4058 family protein [Anaerolineae bacterium]|nr:DUF4058 family protein [Anaerolineae bacterium]